ncbi:hypothetical protein JTB14_030134 [Gonioctena quinquepunctata]|nr:hypothetical protein JTB14_030134 [Gonioctena quinquepunctata]
MAKYQQINSSIRPLITTPDKIQIRNSVHPVWKKQLLYQAIQRLFERKFRNHLRQEKACLCLNTDKAIVKHREIRNENPAPNFNPPDSPSSNPRKQKNTSSKQWDQPLNESHQHTHVHHTHTHQTNESKTIDDRNNAHHDTGNTTLTYRRMLGIVFWVSVSDNSCDVDVTKAKCATACTVAELLDTADLDGMFLF